MRKPKIGQCHLCGETDQLTYEHVPPRRAFNENSAFLYWGKQLFGRANFPWDFSDIKGEQHQRGIGWYTLCGKCNNDTGSWYGSAFVDFIYQGYKNYEDLSNQKKLINYRSVKIRFQKVYPLRIIKQIITMFCSINKPDFTTVCSELRSFVLNKEKRGLPKDKYGLYLYVMRGNIARYIGITGILNISRGKTRILSELSVPPFGCVLEINPRETNGYCDITYWGNYFDYNETKDISLDVPVYESNTQFPADYRTKQEVLNEYIKNKLWELQRYEK